MIRALVWKEAREQGLIVSALAVLGAGVLVAVGVFNPTATDSSSRQLLTDTGFLSLLMLTVTAGVVVGGTLFAGEKEGGTFAFLTLLPVPRWKVWAGKLCGGAVLVVAVTAVLFAVGAAVGVVGPVKYLAVWGVVILVVALSAFAWGSVGSVFARSSLSAAGLGGLIGVGVTAMLVPVGWAAAGGYSRWWARRFATNPSGEEWVYVVPLIVLFATFAFPFLLSLWMFTAPDRNRKMRAVFGPTPAGKKKPFRLPTNPLRLLKRPFPGTRASLWMVWRQTRRSAFVLGLLGVGCGLLMLIPGTPVLAVWPGVTLFLAVLVGAIGWADEQGSGAGRFWVERRIPVGRLWGGKAFIGLLVTLVVSFLTALPTVLVWWLARTPWEDRGSVLACAEGPIFKWAEGEIFNRYNSFPLFRYLLLWPVYGFAFGHLVGLLFRKAIVAVAVATMTAAVAAAVWLPSLLGGGVHHWQLWLVPLLVLLTARVLAWRSAADLVGSGTALGRLAVGGAAVLLAAAAGLGYRVLEIPDPPERDDDNNFRAEIPPFATNDSGREVRRAAVVLIANRGDAHLMSAVSEIPNMPKPYYYYPLEVPTQVFNKVRQRQLETVMEHGWQPGDADFEAWLAKMFDGDWKAMIEEAVRMPVGTVEDPTELEFNSPLRHLYGLQGADTLLLVDALRRQANGDPAAFVRAYDTVLGLSRIVRHKSILACAVAGRRMERRAHQALTRWLERLSGNEELIRAVERSLAAHARWATDDKADVRLAEQVVLRNSVKAPVVVLRETWHYNRAGRTEDSKRVMDAEADLVAVAWQVPWERERHARLVGSANRRPFTPDIEHPELSPFWGMPGIGWGAELYSFVIDKVHAAAEIRATADRRAAAILLAIRRYELKRGTPPPALADLVPDFLSAVPLDQDGRPVRYRISIGEVMPAATQTEWPEMVLPEELLAVVAAAGGLALPDLSYIQPPGTFGAFRGQIAIPPGRAILWSVGSNIIDLGGKEFSTFGRTTGDWVYLVPPVPAPPHEEKR